MTVVRPSRPYALLAAISTVSAVMAGGAGISYYGHTSTSGYCASCHEMTTAYKQWKASSHYNGKSGVVANCIDCHLPPAGIKKLVYKSYFGAKDQYAHLFKDVSKIDWEERKKQVGHYTFEAGCKKCHTNLFPSSLTVAGLNAHREYVGGLTNKKCFDCHRNLVHKERG